LAIFDDLSRARDLETLLLFDLVRDKFCRNKAVFPLTGCAKLYPTKDPKIRKKLSELRKSTPLSPAQLSHITELNLSQKKENHPRADRTQRAFINIETQELLYGTIFDLERKGLSLHEARSARSRTANYGVTDLSSPWVLAECTLNGRKMSYDRLYTFISVNTGKQLTCSLRDLSKMVHKPSSLTIEILFGKVRYGWKLNDYPKGVGPSGSKRDAPLCG